MIRDHLTSLSDVYQQLKEDKAKKTTYILQFMWRDLSSKFDLIGPYYTSECGLDSRFTTACLFEVMQAMESTGFQIHALICDGASWNLTMLKHLCGAVGKFGCGEMTDPERYGVLCSFKNPFSDNNVWIIICPSHQVQLLYHLGISQYKKNVHVTAKSFLIKINGDTLLYVAGTMSYSVPTKRNILISGVPL